MLLLLALPKLQAGPQLELAGLAVTPHVQSKEMRYRREPDLCLGARVELFLQNTGDADLPLAPDAAIRRRGKSSIPEQQQRG
jgi:hypothetical protein